MQLSRVNYVHDYSWKFYRCVMSCYVIVQVGVANTHDVIADHGVTAVEFGHGRFRGGQRRFAPRRSILGCGSSCVDEIFLPLADFICEQSSIMTTANSDGHWIDLGFRLHEVIVIRVLIVPVDEFDLISHIS